MQRARNHLRGNALRTVAATVLLAAAWAAAAPPRGVAGPRPVSVQLHAHGSLSEGTGSHATHAAESQRAGVEAIFWSDHDWRVDSYHHTTSYSFEALSTPVDDREAWTANLTSELVGSKSITVGSSAGFASAASEITTQAKYDGKASLRLSATETGSTPRVFEAKLGASRERFIYSLAKGVTFGIAIMPVQVGTDATAQVTVALQMHPDPSLIAGRWYIIRWYLDNTTTTPYRTNETWNVPLPYTIGQWTDYLLDPVAEAAAGFAADSRDHATRDIRFGVESANGAPVDAFFDAFRLNVTRDGQEALEEQRRMLDALETAYPHVRHHQGLEVSYVGRHVNAYTPEPFRIPDYDALAASSGLADPTTGVISDEVGFGDHVVRRSVERIHELGGLASLNHPFGTKEPIGPSAPSREQVLGDLLTIGLYDCDLLEVGYRLRSATLADLLWVWDQLSLAGIRAIGVGTTDSHRGLWLEYETLLNNFVSWVWADSDARDDLLAGMRAGRVFFGDPSLFRGSLDLSTERGQRMGQTVVTDRHRARVTMELDGVAAGDSVSWRVNGSRVTSWPAPSTSFEANHRLDLPAGDAFVRVEVARPGGRQMVFSNPIWFTRAVPPKGLREGSWSLDLAGVRTLRSEHLRLVDARALERPRARLSLTLSARGSGELELDTGPHGAPRSVELRGLSGVWSYDAGVLTIGGITGDGVANIGF